MKRYEVIVAGSVVGTHKDRKEAEKHLEMMKNSYLRMVHPLDCFWIRERA